MQRRIPSLLKQEGANRRRASTPESGSARSQAGPSEGDDTVPDEFFEDDLLSRTPRSQMEMDKKKDIMEAAVLEAGKFTKVHKGKVTEYYKGLRTLGNGAFGTVLLVEDRLVFPASKSTADAPTPTPSPRPQASATPRKYACKILTNGQMQPKQKAALKKEMDLLRSCDHPHIMKMLEIFEDEHFTYLICELMQGGELFDFITSDDPDRRKMRESMSKEFAAAKIMRQVLSGIAYLHDKGIVHRDLKPENILLTSKTSLDDLKIIDLGLGSFYEADSPTKLIEKVGTPYYIAPEVLEKSYGPGCDVWSLGVLLYILISGRPPFGGRTDQDILKAVQRRKYNFDGREWKGIASETRDLIDRMLTYPPAKRITAQQALAHPFFRALKNQPRAALTLETSGPNFNELRRNLGRHQGMLKLQHAVKLIISYHANKDAQVEELSKIFQAFDKDDNRVLDREELVALYRALNQNESTKLTEEENRTARSAASKVPGLKALATGAPEVEPSDLPPAAELSCDVIRENANKLFDRIDANHDNRIEISEWLAVALDDQYFFGVDKLGKAFEIFDTDSSGTISAAEIMSILQLPPQDEPTITEYVKMHDRDGDGELSFEEFKDMLLDKKSILQR